MKLRIKKISSGFTLLELLIVIGILGVLSVALVFVLNPSESLKKARDSQRISDLTTLKKAIEIYKTNVRYPKLAGADNTGCKGTALTADWQPATDHIYYSYPSDTGVISATVLDGTTFSAGVAVQKTKANAGKTDGTGWLPIDFSSLSGGSPVSTLPVDPVNTIANLASPANTDLVYRYICSEKDLTFELNATLESTAFTSTDNKMAKDGGNNANYYEVGTGLGVISFEGPPICGAYIVSGLDGLTYGTVTGEDGKCWLDRNLGATQVATSYSDTASYGHYYQWGRYADGHQISNSSTIVGPVSTDTPSANFITNSSGVSPNDWRTPQNDNLWQGVNGTNNPCPSGFRLPTQTEWQTLVTAIGGFTTATCGGTSTCRQVAYGSRLKLPSGGLRGYESAGVNNLGSSGMYWSSITTNIYSYYLYFLSSGVVPYNSSTRGNGFSVRCIKN